MIRVDQPAEGRQGFANFTHSEVTGLIQPCRKQVLVGNEVAQVALEVVESFHVVLVTALSSSSE